MDQDIELIEIEQENIEIENIDEKFNTSIESPVEDIYIEEPETPDEQMYESLLGTSTVHTDVNHSQYLPNQHTIGAITGLTETLENIQALKDTICTQEINQANYYLWNDENPLQENRKGLFVCINENNKISICSNQNNIFGVTVESAGFVGGQDEIAHDYKYDLVVNSGLVNVKCELDVVSGDYVRPNAYGKAKKDDIYGYKVIYVNAIGDDRYAAISLSSIFDGVCDVQDRVDSLEGRMDNAEINIAAAVTLSNDAYNIAESSIEAIRVADESNNKATTALNTVNNMQDDIEDAVLNAEQALNIANATSTTAVNICNAAVSTANQALTDALNAVNTANTLEVTVDEHTATLESISNWQTETGNTISQLQQIPGQIQGLVANIDKYRVGDYSQANGLTFEQAIDILDINSAYIPTKNHTEVYINTPTDVTTRFNRGFYYTWSNNGWVESASSMVNISRIYISGNSNTPYWYVDSNEDIVYNDETYTAHSLYFWENGAWEKVTTFNSLGRSVGLLQAKSDEILAEITNARGSEASLDLRISNNEAQASMIASIITDNADIIISGTVESISALPSGQDNNTYYAVGSGMPYDVYKYDGTDWNIISYLSYDGVNVKEIHAASIVNAVNDSGSAININADKINFTGFTTFLKPSDVGSSGSTTIDGARITTGTVNAARLNISDVITAVNNNTTTTISGGKITTNSITTNQLATDAIKSNNYIYISGIVNNYASLPDRQASGTYYAVGTSTNKNVYQYDGSSWSQVSGATYDRSEVGICRGTYLNLSDGAFNTKNFKIAANGDVTASNMTLTGGAIQSSNYHIDNDTDECDAGMKINLSQGTIDSPNFKIDSGGNVTATGMALEYCTIGGQTVSAGIPATVINYNTSTVIGGSGGYINSGYIDTVYSTTTRANTLVAGYINLGISEGGTGLQTRVSLDGNGITYQNHAYGWSEILSATSGTAKFG